MKPPRRSPENRRKIWRILIILGYVALLVNQYMILRLMLHQRQIIWVQQKVIVHLALDKRNCQQRLQQYEPPMTIGRK